jgi:hypothetical protein
MVHQRFAVSRDGGVSLGLQGRPSDTCTRPHVETEVSRLYSRHDTCYHKARTGSVALGPVSSEVNLPACEARHPPPSLADVMNGGA